MRTDQPSPKYIMEQQPQLCCRCLSLLSDFLPLLELLIAYNFPIVRLLLIFLLLPPLSLKLAMFRQGCSYTDLDMHICGVKD